LKATFSREDFAVVNVPAINAFRNGFRQLAGFQVQGQLAEESKLIWLKQTNLVFTYVHF
jgi:hypothetical protein